MIHSRAMMTSTGWSNWILLREWKYVICCLRDLLLCFVCHLSNSKYNISISGVKSSWTSLYERIKHHCRARHNTCKLILRTNRSSQLCELHNQFLPSVGGGRRRGLAPVANLHSHIHATSCQNEGEPLHDAAYQMAEGQERALSDVARRLICCKSALFCLDLFEPRLIQFGAG